MSHLGVRVVEKFETARSDVREVGVQASQVRLFRFNQAEACKGEFVNEGIVSQLHRASVGIIGGVRHLVLVQAALQHTFEVLYTGTFIGVFIRCVHYYGDETSLGFTLHG